MRSSPELQRAQARVVLIIVGVPYPVGIVRYRLRAAVWYAYVSTYLLYVHTYIRTVQLLTRYLGSS